MPIEEEIQDLKELQVKIVEELQVQKNRLSKLEGDKLTYSLKQASYFTGMTIQTLRDLFHEGTITGIKTSKNIYLHAHSVKAFFNIQQIGK